MTIRTIPQNLPDLFNAGTGALAGALSRGVTIGLAQNTAARIAADLYNVFGEPGENPTIIGQQSELNGKREDVTAAQAVRREAREAGRAFCANAVDLLKIHFGRTWNPGWLAAGFTQSISVNRGDVMGQLVQIRNYFRDNPTRESVPLGITAALADARIAAVEGAQAALNSAVGARKLATEERDAAVQALRDRLSGLREELDQLLSDDDVRWHDFGFTRPIDVRSPNAVTGLILTAGLPGQVFVQHDASPRATGYRISWKLQEGSGDPTMVGLFADLSVTLSGLPSGSAITVGVTARNEAGETQPTEANIVVP